ncbi:MMPL family transporter [Dongia sp.]|uniref:MMPL family transporter n=1 Tax=Dongia sp. TaxID=1977262 RepID=UPI0035B0B8C3
MKPFRLARLGAALWLLIVLITAGYLGSQALRGIAFRTDLLSLLPADETAQESHTVATNLMTGAAKRFVLLVGHVDRTVARMAAAELERSLGEAGLARVRETTGDQSNAMGAFYLPYAGSLLAPGDRALLAAGKSDRVAKRALAQIYGVGGFANGRLLMQDPFLLFPAFLASLPAPLSRLTVDEGRLAVKADGLNWILVSGEVDGDPYALDVQDRFLGVLEGKTGQLSGQHPGLAVKRAGAIFFAAAGSQSGLKETSTLGTISMVGTALLLIGAFRRVGPLLMNLLAVAIGIGAGLAANLWLFGEIHIATLLFGVGLTGVAVDYGIHYSATVFDPLQPTSWQRLRTVLPGISIGLTTTLIGYAILLMAPFPALRQVALFSIVGLAASFFTVILWFPFLDRGKAPGYGRHLLRLANCFWRIWENARLRRVCWLGLAVLTGLGAVGFTRLHIDDDVRRMQSLSPDLVAQQDDIQRLAGIGATLQFVLVEAADDEIALQRSEAVSAILDNLQGDGVLGAHRGPADFVPSLARQAENRQLVQRLDWVAQATQLGLASHEKPVAKEMILQDALEGGALPFLREWVLGPGRHVIALDDVEMPETLHEALANLEGVRYLDPAGDFTERLGTYRHRALWLIGLSALLMIVPLGWRYGLKGGVIVLLPSLAALILAPALVAVSGEGISFFHVMGLILVLAIGVDYATFCAETDLAHRPVTMLAVMLDVVTTLLSFGLLAFSSVFAVHAFGLTMLIGILIAFLLAPLAGTIYPRRKRPA